MSVRRTLPQRQRSLVGAWCFADHYGPIEVAGGGGMDLPPHPHTGLQTVTWLFAGLRSDELVRLRAGCIRWQNADGGPAAGNAHVPGDDATCLLDVPTHKTGACYTKPVDPLVGEAIALWEAKRPPQPLLVEATPPPHATH